MRFAQSWLTAPAIVAESLVGVPDVLLTALRPGVPASGAAVAASLARSLSPREHPACAPAWLLPPQIRSFRRILAAIHRFGGALLADPVGSGKTYVALAVAAAVNRGPTACLVPASLLAQWHTTADRLSIPVTLCSHEQISRGRLPAGTRGLVVIDESHHFRNPETLRYQNLAPWLVGREALLVSATPIVNRIMDLVHQLLLTARDDALSLHGVPSLSGMVAAECPQPALGHLVFEQVVESVERPARTYTNSMATQQENSAICRSINRLSQLRLSRSAPIAALIQGVLLRALASSPAAYNSALRRYHGLLLHAREAGQAGHVLDRSALRRFIGDMADQLVLWELFSSTEAATDLNLDDLGILAHLLADAASAPADSDGKILRLRGLLADGRPTLVFTAYRDTVGYLRRQLEDFGIAWCTGECAGIGRASLPRRAVLDWFRKPTASSHAPQHLVVTDVAAEGLDLPRAARVVHYDLPWTPMRLEQREGRSVRYGSSHAAVEIVQFRLPALLERRLGIEATLARKKQLPAVAGFGSGGRRLWGWRSELAGRYASAHAREGVASVSSERPGLLAGFAIGTFAGDSAATVVWLEADGSWTEAPEVIEAQLEIAAREPAIIPIAPDELREWLSLLAKPIRTRLAFTRSRRWMTLEPTGRIRTLVSRLQSCMKTAARRRDADQLGRLERAMTFVVGGHTAGEAALLERLARASDSELYRLLPTLPSQRRGWEDLQVRLGGMVLFRPPHPAPARVVSPECPGCKPHSSISMEP
ncbi:MAG TPA: helicase-related protein [Gemmatimonadales bacterium]|nr:helicase-related protein [Gemmatimonadales bacterium]